MGFWDVAGKVAKGVGRLALYAGEKAYDAAGNYAQKVNGYRDELSGMSDKDVMYTYRNSNGTKKMLAIQELKDRGLM